MNIQTWESLCIFDNSVPVGRVRLRGVPLKIPVGVEEVIRRNWDAQLRQKQEQLAREGIVAEIQPYHYHHSDQPLNALYEGDEPKMWPGPTVSLTDFIIGDSGIDLLVSQASFPFIAGLKDEEVSRLYAEQGIAKPRPALAISTFALTQDGQLTLTVRGSRTNMYPGRLYGQGGNPLFTSSEIAESQADEIRNEILVQTDEYDLGAMKFSGIVVDKEHFPGKPDLVGWHQVNLEAADIQARVLKRTARERPNDAIGVVFAPATEGALFDYLAKRTHPVQFCPPAHGGLILYGHHNFGRDWAKELLDHFK